MPKLEFNFTKDPTQKNGVWTTFTDGKGNSTESWWSSPPENIDHTDITYLQERHGNIRNEKHVAFIKKAFAEQRAELNAAPQFTIKLLNKHGQKFIATLEKSGETIGSVGNDNDGFYVKLRTQATLRETVQILNAAEKFAPAFDNRKFRLVITG